MLHLDVTTLLEFFEAACIAFDGVPYAIVGDWPWASLTDAYKADLHEKKHTAKFAARALRAMSTRAPQEPYTKRELAKFIPMVVGRFMPDAFQELEDANDYLRELCDRLNDSATLECPSDLFLSEDMDLLPTSRPAAHVAVDGHAVDVDMIAYKAAYPRIPVRRRPRLR